MRYGTLILLTATGLLATGCETYRVNGPVSGCSDLAKPILERTTPHATLENSGDPAQDWQLYGVGETGQLNQANTDKRDGLQIVQTCEARDREARERLERPWWRFW